MEPPIRIEADGNPLHPLPPDYYDLTSEGQRQARVNGCRQWLLKPHSLQEKGDLYLASLRLFDAYYLHPDHAVDFNPYFYPKDPLPSPFYHERISFHGAVQRLLVAIGPRGGAKSKLAEKNMLMRLVSSPAYSFTYCTSTQPNAARTSENLRGQASTNTRLNDDFGRLVPKRGEAIFSTDLSYFTNRSWIQFLSIDSRIRGLRPTCFLIDDPEWDPKASTSMAVVRAQMEHMLFRVILPTVMEEDASVIWYATFVSKQHYAWIAAGSDSTTGEALDPRFEHWYRIIVRACETNEETGQLVSCWEDKWPATKAARIKKAEQDPRYYNMVSLEEIKSIVGPRSWQSEYMANPGESEDQFFGTLDRKKHGWWYEDIDVELDETPHRSHTKICWFDAHEVLHKMPMHEFFTISRRFTTADTSYTSGPTSDYKACAIMAIAPGNVLLVLDLWAKQCDQRVLEEAVWVKSIRWRCPVIGVEYVHQGIALYNSLISTVQTRATEVIGTDTDFMPRIMKIKPGQYEKEAKIAGALALRFHHGLIKLPFFKRGSRPWRDLFNQIEEFNPDAKNGGLQHDDHIDVVAMHSFLVKTRVRPQEKEPQKPQTVEEMLVAGIDKVNGVPLATSIDWRHVPVALVRQLLQDRVYDHGNHRPTKV